MGSYIFKFFLSALLVSIYFSCNTSSTDEKTDQPGEDIVEEERIKIVENDKEDRVDVFIDKLLFTSYIHPENIKKPVLYPIYSSSGIEVTRGFPIDPEPGDRTDHPHHVGLWLNHGDVNDLDFWNNSESVPEIRKMGYGTIYHKKVRRTQNGNDIGLLEVSAAWERSDGRTILDENTKFFFSGENNLRIIDRVTTLTASEIQVLFQDSKEGMMGLRVTRELEQPANETITVLNESLEPVQVSPGEQQIARGIYVNSEGFTGDEVWGKRARWVKLASEIEGKPIGVIMMDHPENKNYPAHWHARGYGLFAVNPFGSRMYTDGQEDFNFFLPQEESVILKYRVVVYEGAEPDSSDINILHDRFTSDYQGKTRKN